MGNISDKRYTENLKARFGFNNFFENRTVCEITWLKNCTAAEAREDSAYICNTYCLSTATMVTQKHPTLTLQVHCLTCYM